MNVPNRNQNDLIALLSNLILAKDSDTPFRLNEQERALKELECSDEQLGQWIAGCDFPFLMETLTLDDAIFRKEFPNVRLTPAERGELVSALELHCETCPRCHLKRGYDMEWLSRVDRALAGNKQALGDAIALALSKK